MNKKPNGEYLTISVVSSGYLGHTMYACLKMPQKEVYFKHFIRKAYSQHGAFLGLVHALAQMEADNISLPVYTTDNTALSWIKKRLCTTKWNNKSLKESEILVSRALKWLKTNTYTTPKLWNKNVYGEMPRVTIEKEVLRKLWRKAGKEIFAEPMPQGQYLVVDASCTGGNPGQVEYRGILIPEYYELFRYGTFKATNNIGEYLALVHGLAEIERRGLDIPIYSDSATALSWVRRKVCNTKWEKYPEIAECRSLVERATQWINTHSFTMPLKWNTQDWGEIPADYGRK